MKTKTKVALATAAGALLALRYDVLLATLFLMGTHSAVFGPLKFSILPQHLAPEDAEVFAQAIAADASVAEPYYHLGEVYEKQGKADLAIEQYTLYLNLASPDDQFHATAIAALERLKQ